MIIHKCVPWNKNAGLKTSETLNKNLIHQLLLSCIRTPQRVLSQKILCLMTSRQITDAIKKIYWRHNVTYYMLWSVYYLLLISFSSQSCCHLNLVLLLLPVWVWRHSTSQFRAGLAKLKWALGYSIMEWEGNSNLFWLSNYNWLIRNNS